VLLARYYSGDQIKEKEMGVEPKEISTASFRDLCLFIRDTGIMNLCC
jgi:hypothetical protein